MDLNEILGLQTFYIDFWKPDVIFCIINLSSNPH